MKTSLPIPPEAAQLAQAKATEAEAILEAFKGFDVTAPDGVNRATILFRNVKDRYHELNDQRKHIVMPLKTAIERVDDLFRPALTTLRRAQEIIRDKLADAERGRMEQNRKARLSAQVSAATGVGSPSAALAQVRPESDTKAPGLTYRKGWDYEIENAFDVPREFLTIDYKKLNAFCKTHSKSEAIPHIPGVKFSRKATPVIRKR